MMNKTWRFAWMCLLVLALPVQGHAVTRMLFCQPVPQVAHPAADDSAGLHGDHTAHDMHHVGHDGDTSTTTANAASTPTHSKCSACASCCLGLALVPAVMTVPAAPVAPERVTAPDITFQVQTPRRLDRPPRPRLA